MCNYNADNPVPPSPQTSKAKSRAKLYIGDDVVDIQTNRKSFVLHHYANLPKLQFTPYAGRCVYHSKANATVNVVKGQPEAQRIVVKKGRILSIAVFLEV